MKSLAVIAVFCLSFLTSKGSNPYRNYLRLKIYTQTSLLIYPIARPLQLPEGTDIYIPHTYIAQYEIPKGAIFCRMEDKVTRATKVWLKLGVQ